MWAGFGVDSLPQLPVVLAKAWAAPPVLEHPRHFTDMSGASAGMAARAGGWLGLSLSLQSLSSSLSFYVASLSPPAWLDFFTWWPAFKRAQVEAVSVLLRPRPELSGHQLRCIC